MNAAYEERTGALMPLGTNYRTIKDRNGQEWMVRETVGGRVAVTGSHALHPSPWITFTNESGERLSGFARTSMDGMTDDQLLELLAEMIRRERRAQKDIS